MSPQVNTVYIYYEARLLDAQKWAQQHAVGCSEVGATMPLAGCSEAGTAGE